MFTLNIKIKLNSSLLLLIFMIFILILIMMFIKDIVFVYFIPINLMKNMVYKKEFFKLLLFLTFITMIYCLWLLFVLILILFTFILMFNNYLFFVMSKLKDILKITLLIILNFEIKINILV